MSFKLTLRNSLLSLVCAALLPFGSAVAQTANLLNVVDPGHQFTWASRAYSEMDDVYARTGVPRSIAQVRQVALGQSKSELTRVLGQAVAGHSDGSLEFSLALPLTGQDRLICQYRVFLDENELVEAAVWRRPQCANLVVNGRS